MEKVAQNTSLITPPSCVIHIPELVTLICSFLKKRDHAKLLYASRQTFACVALIVWKDIEIKFILLLIPGVCVIQKSFENDRPTVSRGKKIDFPAVADLTRFNIYSSFVKEVYTAMPYSINFPDRFKTAIRTSVQLKTLLPSLESLTVNTYGSIEDKYAAWIPLLLTPGLKEFVIYSTTLKESEGEDPWVDHSWMSEELCLQLLNTICQTCHTIERLEIFPPELVDSEPNFSTALCNNIATLRQLRFLTIGTTNPNQKLFDVLGQLPYLIRLTLASDYSQEAPGDGDLVTLPDDSFPALQHLGISHLSPRVIRRICELPQLFRRLVTSTVRMLEAEPDEGDLVPGSLRSFYAINCFSHQSSQLVQLEIYFKGMTEPFNFLPPFVGIFKSLPLRRLSLDAVDLEPFYDDDERREIGLESDHSEATWSDFLAAVPDLEELHLDGQTLGVKDLQAFAQMLPKLRLLRLFSIDHDSFEVVSDPDWDLRTQQITIRCRVYSSSHSRLITEDAYISGISHSIHSIWPNATFESFVDWDYRPSTPQEEVANKLNSAMWQYTSGSKSR